MSELSAPARHLVLRYRELGIRKDRDAVEEDVADELRAVLMICLDHRGEPGVERIVDHLVHQYFGEDFLRSI